MRTAAPASERVTSTLWGFAPFAAIVTVHVVALAVDAAAVADPSKLLLMPALAGAVIWAGRRSRPAGFAALLTAVALSWLGDSVGVLPALLPTIPLMLLLFGLAHVAYIRLFVRWIAVQRLPRWALLYAAWWVALLAAMAALLLPQPNGGLMLAALAVYGALLGATAITAARCTPAVAVGAALFLASDSLLAFRLFAPDAALEWTSPLIMLLYGAGQGLIALGAVRTPPRQAVRA